MYLEAVQPYLPIVTGPLMPEASVCFSVFVVSEAGLTEGVSWLQEVMQARITRINKVRIIGVNIRC